MSSATTPGAGRQRNTETMSVTLLTVRGCESAAVKSGRYLVEGRLVVQSVDGKRIRALCRGDGNIYRLGHEPGIGWRCTCPCRTPNCSHLRALRSVVALEPPGPA